MEMSTILLHSFVASLSTLVVGFIWYNPKVFGTIWMRETGMTEEKAKKSNMGMVFAMAIFYGFLISFVLHMMTIHQFGAYGMIGGDPMAADIKPSFNAFMAGYGNEFRTFKHGAFHGFWAGLLFALPDVGTGALFEQRSWKYTLVSGGYWGVSCMLMGANGCGWE